MRLTLFFCVLFNVVFLFAKAEGIDSSLYLKKSITGKISPKSVVHNGQGIFFAQNMMYRHTVTVYDRNYTEIAVIKDVVNPSKYGFDEYNCKLKGGPVECAFSHNGKYAWVSNYNMSGCDSTQFVKPGCDNCSGTGKYDSSFVYKINVFSKEIEAIVKVGAVPKYVATSPDDKWVLVTNWSSGDLSIVDASLNKEVKRIKLGTFPRGIVVDNKSKFAYCTVMGSTKIARVSLVDFSVNFIDNVGKGPRHLCISPDDKWLYLTLNSENKIAKIDLSNWSVKKLKVGHQPRSMAISKDGRSLFIVNYNDNTFSKVDAESFKTLAISKTKTHPIGITYDDARNEVWVACYSGFLQVFKDSLIKSDYNYEDNGLEDDQLAINSNGSISVAHLDQEKIDTIDSVIEEEQIIAIATDISSSILPVRRLYLDFSKKFNVKLQSKPVVVENEKVELSEYIHPKVSSSLNASDGHLVVVGTFGDPINAKNMIAVMESKGLNANSFFNSEKGMTYVFVQSNNDLTILKSWANSNIPSDVEYWIMHK